MNYNPLDPLQADQIVNLTALARKVTDPLMGSGSGNTTMMCYTTGKGGSKCFSYNGKNDIACTGNKCFVVFQTRNQRILSKRNRLTDLGLDVLMMPDGLSSSVLVVGNVKKNQFRVLKNMIGDFEHRTVPELPIIHNGFPSPPSKCHVNPLAKECSPYLSSDDWEWFPGIGLKKKIDIINNPREVFKSEILPELEKAKDNITKIFNREIVTPTSKKSIKIDPMQQISLENKLLSKQS